MNGILFIEELFIITHSFVNEITSVQGASNYYMVSFDVENLFTNVPLYERPLTIV